MDAHDLYGLPLERFVPERTALARELRRRGERDEAKLVASLGKPSVAAWAVNQLVRTQGRAVAGLFKAGDAVQHSQDQLLAGRGDAETLRTALSRERAAVDKLTEIAQGLLSSEGHELSPATLQRVADSLHAAALDEEARAQVQDGCLQWELKHVGFTGAASAATPPRRRATDRGASRRKAQAEAAAREAAKRAEEELAAAQAKHDLAAETLAQAEAELAAARERARKAKAAQRRRGR